MTSNNERGVALILALFLTAALSVLAGSLMFLSQSETYASMNYRMMSQARYAAEAGVQKAGSFIFDQTQYQKPGTVPGDPLSNYNYTSSPVTLNSNNQPVVLSTTAGASNYPVNAVIASFQAAAQGTLNAGGTTVSYSTTARLLSMQTFDAYGGTPSGSPGVVQIWEITSLGTLSGSRSATVQVVALAEQPVWPANSYGAFATANTCGALNFGGTTDVNSYDSTGMTGTASPTISNTGGNVGTNGNLTIGGSVDVYGNLYTPRTGVAACTAGSVTALTETGNANVGGSTIPLPGNIAYPTPQLPSPLPGTSTISITQSNVASACTLLGFATGCTITSSWNGGNQMSTISISAGGAPISLPNISLSSHVTLEFAANAAPAQAVNMNSLDLTGGGTIAVMASASNQAVIVNLVGKNADGTNMSTVLDFGGNSGGSFSNNSTCTGCSQFDASMLQFVYGGSGALNMRGNSGAAATFYAPNAAITMSGTADLYGSMLGNTVNNTGNASIHYDRRLSHDYYVEGAQSLGTFTWRTAS
jgi:Tfp pilus assembly protein PilX